jgi:2-polyprenyl-3-methyl-5-hydroxy-6-metoxy-1,4-benzoquinol methylase
MLFELDHWNDPKKNIGGSQNDIIEQVTGARIAMDIIFCSGLKKSDYRKMSILDYGCGTGRVARVMAQLSNMVYGYEPNQTCFEISKDKNNLIEFIGKPTYVNDISHLNNHKFDFIYSTNVIEHLSFETQIELLNNIIEYSKDNGLLVISYSTSKNKDSLGCYLDDSCKQQVLDEDEQLFEIAKSRNQLGIQLRCFKITNGKFMLLI